MSSFVVTGFAGSSRASAASWASSKDDNNQFGRVVDVILDNSHPDYETFGASQALYGIFYQPLFIAAPEESAAPSTRFAYCGQSVLKQIPIKGEIVKLTSRIAVAAIEENSEYSGNQNLTKVYWTEIVPVWNHPHLNIYPDTVQLKSTGEDADLQDFKENPDIKVLQLNSGDTVLEGRHGQSLRFGGTCTSVGGITTEENSGKPYTILRNGQASAPGVTCQEDVNADDASIYLVSDHQVPLVEANRKYAAAKKAPGFVKDYRGKQIVVTSDKVVVNAREDDLILAAKNHLGENAKTVSIDGDDYIGLDADKIYLGTHAKRELEPVLKGSDTVTLLREVFGALTNLLDIISVPDPPPTWTTKTSVAAGVASTSIKALLTRIDSLKSSKVFTE